MSGLRAVRCVVALIGLLCLAGVSRAEVQPPQPPQVSGEAVFQRICAARHASLEPDPAASLFFGIRALPRELLRQLTPDAILNTLTHGKMRVQGKR